MRGDAEAGRLPEPRRRPERAAPGRRRGRSIAFPAVLAAATAAAAAIVLSARCADGGGAASGDEAEDGPAPAGAFARGGQPGYGDQPVRRLFAEAIPDYAIALDAWARAAGDERASAAASLAEARAAVLSSPARAALPARAAEALAEVVRSARAAAEASEARASAATDDLWRAVRELNDELAAADLGYFVDTDVLSYSRERRRVVLIFTFLVEQVSLYEVGGTRARALRLRRLDTLNWTYRLLGFTAAGRRDAVVLLDKVDERLLRGLVPALSPGFVADPWALEPEARSSAWFPAVAGRASEIVREDLAKVVGSAPAERLGRLVARRLEIFRAWDRALEARGATIDPPATLTLTWDPGPRLAGIATAAELEDLQAIEKELAAPESAQVFAALRDPLLASIERHEIQHWVDEHGPDEHPYPDALRELIGDARDRDGRPRALAEQSRAELSAYLAELARDRVTGRLGLALLVGFLVDERMSGTAECYAALIILTELARELGVPAPGALIRNRRVDRERAIELYLRLAAASPEALRAASRRAWERLFERSLPALERVE